MSGEVADGADVSDVDSEVDEVEEQVEEVAEETDEVEAGAADEGEEEGETEETIEETEPQETTNYKDAFKKHPELRKAFFEHNQYTTIFPTPDDARLAYEDVQTLHDYETAIQEGNVNPVIQSIIESNPQAFESFAETFLPNLKAMDEKMFNRAIAPSVSEILRNVQYAAQKSQNKSLFLAVQHISDHLFNTANPPSFQATQAPVPNNGQDRGIQARASDFRQELDQEISTFLNTEASKNLDPNNVLPSMLKKSTIGDIIEESVKILKSNPQAMNQLKIIRDQAARSGFSYESRKKLRDTYVTIMKPIIARMKGPKREEAMKSIGKNAAILGKGKKVIPSSSASTGGKRPVDAKNVDWSKTSARDAIDGKYVLKGTK